MSAAEVLHRVGEQIKRLAWRRYDGGFDPFAAGDGTLPVIPGLRARILGPASPELEASLAGEAVKARFEAFTFLGSTWPGNLRDDHGVPNKAAWHLDPVSGLPWEGAETYCFDVPYRSRTDRGDVKLVWELNRLQFLQPIAVHAARCGDSEDAAGFVAAVVRSWMSANPPFRGVNWNSGIELALRIVSVSIAATALGPGAFRPEDHRLLRTFLNAHAFWLARYESAHSSANNHLVLEALGLFVTGLLCPDFPNAAAWEAKARAILEREVSMQILDDGVGAEQSPTYTGFTVEAYLFASIVADAVGRPLSPTVGERLLSAGIWLRWIMDEGGNVPEIGDNDAGRIVALQQEPERDYVASVLGATSAALRNPSIAPPRAPIHLRDLLFGTPPRPSPAPSGLRIFPAGGYSVWRGPLNGKQAVLVFDHGPLGYLSIAAHGHADTLAVWLHLDDRPVLVDTGTYLYFGDRHWREYARSSLAHNTVTVMSRSSSEPAGPFNWRRKATGRLLDNRDDGERVVLVAEHDGYRDPLGIVHRRTIEVERRPGTVRIVDSLEGSHGASIEIRLLFSPDLTVTSGDDLVVADERGALLRVIGPSDLSGDVIVGGDDSPNGWVSRSFGSRTAATQLRWTGTLGGGAAAATELQII